MNALLPCLESVCDFQFTTGEDAQFMVVRVDDDGLLCVLVDCVPTEYSMNDADDNTGGYEASQLRRKLNGEILELFPEGLRSIMVPFENGDLLRIPSEKEIFGENKYGEREPDDVVQFEPMKKRRNRIAFIRDDEWSCYWLSNKRRNSAAYFVYVYSNGACHSATASSALGVRPAFKIRYL